MMAPNENSIAEAVARLCNLSPLQYDQVRKDEAKALGVRPGTLDAVVKAARNKDDDGLPFEDVEPWHLPVDGNELLHSLVETVRRFIVCDMATAYSTALWVAMTWFIDVVQVAPLGLITAPEMRCGKSTLLSLIGKLVPRPLTASSISPSALYRAVEEWSPTLLIDEVDACLKDNEDLRGIINAGHTRDSAYVIRCVGDNHAVKRFGVWGAKALSGIGKPAPTLLDRSIVLELRRKMPHENVERLRYAEPNLFNDLCSKLARFADDNRNQVRLERPHLPASLNDRQQDNWEPLLAIASVVGNGWPEIAREAAQRLSGSESPSLSIGVELLSDIQELFDHKAVARITTADLIKELVSDEEKPWATYNKGFQIKPRQIAAKLKGYGIQSKTIRLGFDTAKGYERVQFEEAFSRYIPAPPSASVTASQSTDGEGSDVTAVLPVTYETSRYPSRKTKDTRKHSSNLHCDVVTDIAPLGGSAEKGEVLFDFDKVAA